MNALPTAARFFLFLCMLFFSGSGSQAVAADTGASPNTTEPTIPEFVIHTINHEGPIFMAASGNFDGDGKSDMVLFHKLSRETYTKSCTIYFRRNGNLDEAQTEEIQIGEHAGAIAIKDIDSDGIDELCAFDSDGMIVFQPVSDMAGRPKRLLEFPTLLPVTARQIADVNWIADIDSDGRMDVVLPAADGLHLFLQKDEGTFSKTRRYEAHMRASVRADIGQSYVSYRLPTLEFADFNGDGHTDIGAFDFEQMSFFLTDGSSIPTRLVTSPLVQKFTKDFIGATGFSDLNGDDIPDAVLVLMSQKKNFQSEARIYLGRADLSYGDEPANVYMGDANVILPMFLDVTGDGKMEMLLQNINVGFGFFLNYFLRNRVRVDAELRRLGENGAYEQEPMVKRAIYVRASDTGTEPARGVGDFNGDGLDDLAVGIDENRLAFFLSSKDDVLPRHPTFELDVPAYGKMMTRDLNDDGSTDIIILYPQDDMLDKATLILSR